MLRTNVMYYYRVFFTRSYLYTYINVFYGFLHTKKIPKYKQVRIIHIAITRKMHFVTTHPVSIVANPGLIFLKVYLFFRLTWSIGIEKMKLEKRVCQQ